MTCPTCKRGFFKPDPEDLSFNSPRGRCAACDGTGRGRGEAPCRACGGARIQVIGQHLRLGERNIHAACLQTAPELRAFLEAIPFSSREREIAAPILAEVYGKLDTLVAIGLEDIVLDRECTSLSGGELQRLRLGTAMGSPLTGVIYIFDEPSVGLHPLDNRKVLDRLVTLRDRGNSVIMIEHDADSIRAADHIVDVGPGGGRHGGEIAYNGPLEEFIETGTSLTATALRGETDLTVLTPLDPPTDWLSITGGTKHNVRDLELCVPLGRVTTFAGVSGAGKSSVVHGIIGDTLTLGDHADGAWELGDTRITCPREVARVLLVDQKPIGINSRSTPASYLGIWDEIRKIFAGTLEAKARGWTGSFFSYNTGAGRCTECKGQGQLKLEMNFLADAWVQCEACNGRRFGDEAETVRFGGLSIGDVLNLTFDEARAVFAHHRKIIDPIRQAVDLGIGYLTLGQSSPTLSGGESQRLKLVAELSAERRGHTVYILDEPTTGLHKADVVRLVRVLRSLAARGHTVLLIEHDADVIKASDYVVELGPGAGRFGGHVVFRGAPAQLIDAATPWGALLKADRQGPTTRRSRGGDAVRSPLEQR